MKGKILVVDDEETTRRSLADILRLEGCKVRTAASGEAAVEMLEKEAYGLILLDLKMPGMDGLEVMRIANKMAPETQIILLTAHGSLESAIEALRRGAHDYLLKPSSPSQIIRSVAKGLERHAEISRKRGLLEQLASSVQQLKAESAGAEQASSPAATPPEPWVFSLEGGITIDLERREIRQEGQRVNLTPTEGRLMRVLLEGRNRVFSHRELVAKVQGYEATDWEAPEVLRPLVSRLRRKLSNFPGGEKWIANVRGTGYVFEGK